MFYIVFFYKFFC